VPTQAEAVTLIVRGAGVRSSDRWRRAAATASTLDPTGASSRAVGQAEAAHQQQAWNRDVAENKPLADKQAAQASALLAQAQQLQSNERPQRLMGLVQQKNCDKQ
jgi:hypothetical protein